MGNGPLDCLTLFRHLMVDVVVTLSYGCRLGALSKWAMNVEEPLSMAINDFPKRGILVSVSAWSYTFLPNASVFFQRSAVPTWAWNLVCHIPNQRWRQMCNSDKIMAEVRFHYPFVSLH